MASLVDEKYYEVAHPGSLAERSLIKARDQILRDFMAHMMPQEDSTILDVGISDVIGDGSNVLERCYPYQHNITACGLGEGAEFQSAFPQVKYRRIEPNVSLPFEDRCFDIATANAVLEHVGSHDNQLRFVRELTRVAKKAFITVPNRFFPVEQHTAIPFLHFTDASFRVACSLLGKNSWTEDANLILMTKMKLQELAVGLPGQISVGYTGLKMGPFSSNLFLAII